MFTFHFEPIPSKTGNPLIDYFNRHAFKSKSELSLGNYDSDDDENSDYDPDEDLRMMYDDEEYQEMHEE